MTVQQMMDEAFRALGFARARPVDVVILAHTCGVDPDDPVNNDVILMASDMIWDHWMGEPDTPTILDVEQDLRELVRAHDAHNPTNGKG